MTEYFDKKIALFHVKAKSQEEIFDQLSKIFYDKGLITRDYKQKIIEREKEYPTGLLIQGIGVAIPHTDSIYVKQSQIGFMSLEKPVTFKEMGTKDKEISVKLIFMLALKEAHEQLSVLQSLVNMFQNPKVLMQFLEVNQLADFMKLIKENHLH